MKSAKKTNRHGGETAAGQPKVLLYDIESTPNLAWVWGKYEQNTLGDFVKERQIISVAWKWLGEKNVSVLALPMLKTYRKDPENNRELVLKLHELFSKADIAVGHNVDKFDDKMVNTAIILAGLRPPPPHKTVDTLKVAKKHFRFNSNKLDDLCKLFKIGGKTKHWGFELWVRCMAGDKKAWALMMKYNKNDVVLLEKLYLKLRPWMQNHPDMNLADRHVGCPHCRGTRFRMGGWNYARSGNSRRYQCLSAGCGRWSSVKMTGIGEKKEFWYK